MKKLWTTYRSEIELARDMLFLFGSMYFIDRGVKQDELWMKLLGFVFLLSVVYIILGYVLNFLKSLKR